MTRALKRAIRWISVLMALLNRLRNSDLVVWKIYSFHRQNGSSKFRNSWQLHVIPFTDASRSLN